MNIIKLSPEYGFWPTWKISSDGTENIAPNTLPISKHLVTLLYEIENEYNAILNQNDPLSSGFPSERKRINFMDKVYRTFMIMKFELNNQYSCELSKNLIYRL